MDSNAAKVLVRLSEKVFEQYSSMDSADILRPNGPNGAASVPRRAMFRASPGLFRQFLRSVLRSSNRVLVVE